jgi:hypothetical protein
MAKKTLEQQIIFVKSALLHLGVLIEGAAGFIYRSSARLEGLVASEIEPLL